MPKPKEILLRSLDKIGVCYEEREKFVNNFGEGSEYTRELHERAVRVRMPFGWAIGHLLKGAAQSRARRQLVVTGSETGGDDLIRARAEIFYHNFHAPDNEFRNSPAPRKPKAKKRKARK